MKLALKAIAKHTGVNIREAILVKRHNPVLEEEMTLSEELVRLEEAVHNYHMAGDTLKAYPELKRHMLSERRIILKHTIGLLARMMMGREMSHPYTQEDIRHGIKRLSRVIITDAKLGGYHLEEELLDTLAPLMSLAQRKQFGKLSYNPLSYLRA